MPYEPKNAYAYVHKIISERNNKPSPPTRTLMVGY